MADSRKNPKVDDFFTKVSKWRAEMEKLREMLLDCGLTEELKWYQPCYTFESSNVAILGGFKEYCALSFFKGALLKDTHGILTSPGENTQSARIIRFTGVNQIADMEQVIKAYIYEAIEIEKSGIEVDFKPTAEYALPEELQNKFIETPALKAAFEALTPGRQHGYILYFSSAKQPKTREARIEKYTQHILDGKGMDD